VDIPSRVETFLKSKWFSYLTIVLLQLKIIWGVWECRDLPSADTASYFLTAWEWFKTGRGLITWSPLYTLFYGSLLHITTDALVVTMLHRVLIVLTLSVLVLALMRQILPPVLAWMMALWWVILPIDFNSLYEVHLFAVIPILIAVLAVFSLPGPRGRGWGLAILTISAVLMRNEISLAASLFALCCLCWELWRIRARVMTPQGVMRAYGIPMLAACVCIGGFWFRASDKRIIGDLLRRKHTLNICQVYAFGYQQRHTDWKGSPWTECQQLMTHVYGVPEPSLAEAFHRNPKAVLEHFEWNIKLIPNGLQVLLFNAMSGEVNPDYVPVNRSSFALPLSIGLCALLLAGAVVLWRDRRYWFKLWLPDRVWGWIAMACIACVVPGIILSQRPRPSYLLAFGIIIRCAAGLCIFLIFHRNRWRKRVEAVFPAAAVLAILLTPFYFSLARSSRPLVQTYQTLLPFHEWIEKPDAGFVSNGWADDLCSYIGHSRSCRAFNYQDLRSQVTPERKIADILEANRVSMVFADATMLADPVIKPLIAAPQAAGWRRIAMRHDGYQDWELLVKRPAPTTLPGEPPPLDESIRDIADASEGIELGAGWYPFEVFQGSSFRWVNNDAEIRLQRNGGGRLAFVVEGGPSLNGRPLVLQIFGNDKLLQTTDVRGRQIVEVPLPRGLVAIRLHTQSEGKAVPNDTRILNFRVFRMWTK